VFNYFNFKVERLLELHFKYLDKVRHVDNQIEREKSVSILLAAFYYTIALVYVYFSELQIKCSE
jgi:hypothetical protein